MGINTCGRSKIVFFLFIILLLVSSYLKAQTTQNSTQQNYFLPNAISVTVGGSFIVTGTFPAIPGERVDQFITRIILQEADNNNYNQIISETGLRNIKHKRFDGSEDIIDLIKFRYTGNYKDNPLLKNGDILIFEPRNIGTNYISVSGAVKKSINFQYVEGDSLSDALLFAQGLNPAYDRINSIDISRLSYDGKSEEIISLDPGDNIELKRGDRIRVVANEVNRRFFGVRVSGEVESPGLIYITKDNTTLREVIKKAGGFTKDADLDRAEIIRSEISFRDTETGEARSQYLDQLLMFRMAHINLEDSILFMNDNTLRFQRANATIDFNNIMEENSIDGNFIVRAGDAIDIPRKIDLVYVFGHVRNPGYVKFKKDSNYQYYIDLAGGLGEHPQGEIYLIDGKTRSWTNLEDIESYKIESGDFIWVPKEPFRDFDYYLTQIGTIAGIVGSVATVILLAVQISK